MLSVDGGWSTTTIFIMVIFPHTPAKLGRFSFSRLFCHQISITACINFVHEHNGSNSQHNTDEISMSLFVWCKLNLPKKTSRFFLVLKNVISLKLWRRPKAEINNIIVGKLLESFQDPLRWKLKMLVPRRKVSWQHSKFANNLPQ